MKSEKNKSKNVVYPDKISLSVERYLKNGFNFDQDWTDANSGIPNIFNRTSIFSGEKAKNNVSYTGRTILSYINNCSITYNGPAMDKKDHQVFQLCIHAAKENNIFFGETFRIFPAEWLKILKRADNSRSRDELANSLKKMTMANINVVREYGHNEDGAFHEDFSGNILSMFKRVSFKKENDEYVKSRSKTDVKWLIAISPAIKQIVDQDLTLIDIQKSAEIKTCLGLWLYDFYSSHHNPIPISTDRLRLLSGSNSSTIGHFNQALEINLKKLKDIGFISNYSFNQKSRNEKMLVVEKEFLSPIVGKRNQVKERKPETMNLINL